jgi:toxin HigB-1
MGAVIIRAMIKSFKNIGTEDVFDGVASKAARKCCPKSVWPVTRRKLDQINRVQEVTELQIPPGNRLEVSKGDRENQYSIRINQQYRVCFIWEEGQAYELEITDYN